MKDEEQFRKELVELRQRIAELEKSESQCSQAEKSLREAEARYRSIFENAVEGVFQIALDGRILAVNQAAARMLGYDSPEELMAEVPDIRQFYIEPSLRDELIHEVQTKGVVAGFEVQTQRKDGSVIWTSANIWALMDESGRIVGLVGMGIDITERKQAEEKLRESEIRYRTLFEQSPDGVLIIDPQTAIAIEFNKVAHRQLGYTREEFKRLRIFNYEAKETFEETKAHIENVLREGRDDFETKHRTKDGKIRNVLVTIQTIEISGRIFFHCIFRDITERKRIEEALRESEMSYRTLFEKAGDAILILEAEGENAGKIVAANKASAGMHGYTVNELLTLKITDLDTPEVAEETPDRFRRSLRGEWIKEEITHRKKDGTVFPVEVSGGLIEFGNHKYILSFDRDITERKRAEEAIGSEHAFRKAIEDSTLTGVAAVDLEGRQTYVNPAFSRMVGWREEELLGAMPPFVYWPPEEIETISDALQKTVSGRAPHGGFELCFRRRNEERFDVLVLLSPLKDGQGRTTGWLASVYDITERKRIEEALRESEKRYRSLFEDSPISLWEEDFSDIKKCIDNLRDSGVKDFRTYFKNHPEDVEKCSNMVKVVEINQATLELYKAKSKEELLGNLRKVFSEEPDEAFREELIAIAEGKPGFEIEAINQTLTGEKKHIALRWSMAPDYEARWPKVLVSIIDLTERKRAEEILENYAAKLEEANRLKDLFTDIMRHDLLNPLGVIKTATEQILVAETRDERMCNTLQMIKRNADKLIDMIKSASMYAMLESAEKLERKSLDLNEIFREVANNFKLQLEEKNMKLEYISKGGCCVMANPMIDTVFSNLISNAIKYSPVGRKIEVKVIEEKEHFKIYVKDWGYGIRDEDKPKIFTRFQRVDKKGVKGTGLGLAIARRVVDLHGGKIWIEDNPEGGSVFCVEIPKA